MKRVIYIAAFLVTTTLSAVAITTAHDPIDELNTNPEYVELQEREKTLVAKEDSVSMIMNDVRSKFRIYADSLGNEGLTPTPEEFSAFSDRILELEQQIFDIRTMRGDIIARINELEQEWVLAQMNAPIEEEPARENIVEEPVELPLYRNLVDNHCIKDVLLAEDYAELREAQREDAEMDSLVNKYMATYDRMNSVAESYRTVDNEADAEVLFAQFATLKADAEAQAEKIESRWNHILDTKYYAYGYILEHYGLYDLLDNTSADYSAMQQRCANENGRYALDALAHHAIGRPTLVAFERDFAREMGLNKAADSLQRVYENIISPEYHIQP